MREIVRIFMISAVLMLAGCGSRSRGNDALERIDSLSGSDAALAIDMLDNIDYDDLSEKGRHRYDLLSIKCRDKNYERHTSDSLILDVIDYYSGHRDDKFYPEALYYGGRVYSDIGDLPLALEYFQKALDEIPDDTGHRRLKSGILSQTGRLLENLRLYTQSITYIEKAIDICKEQDDSVNVAYNYMMLRTIYNNLDSLDTAKAALHEAIKYSTPMSVEDKAWIKVQHASLLHNEGNIDSALSMIRPLPQLVDSLCRDYTLTVAAKIYGSAGIPDTAYMYAKEVAFGKNLGYRPYGFSIIYSHELRDYIDKDTLLMYVDKHLKAMHDYLDMHEDEGALIKNSRYNYDIHVRERAKAEHERDSLLLIAVFAVSILIITVLYQKIKSLKNEMRLRMAVQIIRSIAYHAECENNKPADIHAIGYKETRALPFYNIQRDKLKKELIDGLQAVCGDKASMPKVDEMLLQSEEYKILENLISKDKTIKSTLWTGIENAVHRSSPEFKKTLGILSSDRMTANEYQTALLTRFGIIPKDIATLLCKSKSTISDRRSSLARKIFDSKYATKELDKLILTI